MRKKRDLNNEVDLVAFISLLSVCICFLLLTAVWIQVGSLNVKQAVGGQAADGPKNPALWTMVQSDGSIRLRLEDAPWKIQKKYRNVLVKSDGGQINWEELKTQVSQIKEKLPQLSMALIQPKKATLYEDIIGMMDVYKEVGLTDLGIAPL